ncbi:MAG: AbrB/MazE/SpoVT family DNA-binding domain-containing protein [Deltaproteobacteria bacterium]|nr:AbrB/MazE/SpoVT family DNA-binding domain-containing protein [Deltaproteobacteria bacterium]
MHARVQKWGNSLAVRIPRPFAADAGLDENSEVDISLKGESLVVKPLVRTPSLKTLLAGITDENIHQELDTGAPVGNEAW